MRPAHWWGAAAAAGVLLSAVVAAPTALATGGGNHHRPRTANAASHKPSSTVKSTVKRSGHHARVRPYHRPGKPKPPKPPHRPGCHYPANGTPSVVLSGPSHSHAGRTVTLNTTVTINKCGREGASAALWASKDNKNWKQISAMTTGKDGKASFNYYARTNTLMRVMVAGGDGVAPGQSDIFKLEVKPAKK